jgi:hypothetical protein
MLVFSTALTFATVGTAAQSISALKTERMVSIESVQPGSRPVAELSLGPLIGLDRPLKGCAGSFLVGLAHPPFEVDVRAGGAYDASLGAGALRIDIGLGLGQGLRAIIGGLLIVGEATLPDPSGGEQRLAVQAASWPNRFGIAATMAEMPWRLLGGRFGIETELVYTAFKIAAGSNSAAAALSGAAAFAAGVEASVALRLRWDSPRLCTRK